MKRKQLSPHIVADPKICHGKPTFQGTRIMVASVIHMVARGLSWNRIIHEYHGKITREGIREALDLAGQVFVEHGREYAHSHE